MLRTWEVESAHNYENNQDIKMVNSTNVLFFTFTSSSLAADHSLNILICICVM